MISKNSLNSKDTIQAPKESEGIKRSPSSESFDTKGNYVENASEREEATSQSEIETSLITDTTTTKDNFLNSISTSFEDIANSIEEAFPKTNSLERNAFPHPRNWLGPRFMLIWSIPIIAIKKIQNLLVSLNPISPYEKSCYTIKKAETIFTTYKAAIDSNRSIRFFGPLFIAIWVIPFGITGIVMDVLFVSPLKGPSPFGSLL